MTRKFLESNGFKMIVRSHECVRSGFDRPYEGSDAGLLCTVFSASNYGGGGNTAAYLVFSTKPPTNDESIEVFPVEGSDLVYGVYYFEVQEGCDDDDAKTTILDASDLSMYDLILSRKAALAKAFQAVDKSSSGGVTTADWATVMKSVLKLEIRWESMVGALVPPDCFQAAASGESEQVLIDYTAFLHSFSATLLLDHAVDDEALDEGLDVEGDEHNAVTGSIVESLYAHHHVLLAVFRFFDRNHTGTITRDEFKQGCDILNQTLPEDQKIKELDRIVSIMDVSAKGEIDLNEFFEMFRLSDAHANISAAMVDLHAEAVSPRGMQNSKSLKMRRSSVDARERRESLDGGEITVTFG